MDILTASLASTVLLGLLGVDVDMTVLGEVARKVLAEVSDCTRQDIKKAGCNIPQ